MQSEAANRVLVIGVLLANLKNSELHFWKRYLADSKQSRASSDVKVSASIAGNETNADSLLQLYLEGKKTAGSGLVRDYEVAGDPLPEVGAYWIILDSSGNPRCIAKTCRVEIHTFDQVPEHVAIAEGEGDLSLEYWKKTHAEFFEPYLKKLGIQDLSQEKVVTEFFEVVFKD